MSVSGLSLCLVVLAASRCAAIQIIKTLSSCSVETDAGVIDLTPLAQTTGGPRFDNLFVGLDVYSWNPCQDFQEPGDDGTPAGCGKVAACQKHGGGYYGLGNQASATFLINPQGQLMLQYTSAYGGRTAHVQLQCDVSQTTATISASGEVTPDNYYFVVTGNVTCPSKSSQPITNETTLTAGSVLVIIFFVLVTCYFVGGVLFMRFRRDARGREMIPNYSMWASVLSSAKSGTMYVFRIRGSGYQEV